MYLTTSSLSILIDSFNYTDLLNGWATVLGAIIAVTFTFYVSLYTLIRQKMNERDELFKRTEHVLTKILDDVNEINLGDTSNKKEIINYYFNNLNTFHDFWTKYLFNFFKEAIKKYNNQARHLLEELNQQNNYISFRRIYLRLISFQENKEVPIITPFLENSFSPERLEQLDKSKNDLDQKTNNIIQLESILYRIKRLTIISIVSLVSMLTSIYLHIIGVDFYGYSILLLSIFMFFSVFIEILLLQASNKKIQSKDFSKLSIYLTLLFVLISLIILDSNKFNHYPQILDEIRRLYLLFIDVFKELINQIMN